MKTRFFRSSTGILLTTGKNDMNVSTRNLNALPDIAGLMRLTQSLAILDAVLSQEWEYRYYSFNHAWADGEKMASMRNGSGDQWFAIFSAAGAALHGVLREAPMYRPGPPPARHLQRPARSISRQPAARTGIHHPGQHVLHLAPGP
ncbi:hypothetical protein [Burkholderia lata]|uniref:hypothetical protein n=1 Tax=Burkholderia lata (strain ATCC 17760 / DSM 23089 / LMG 22485 / NCIMB 9086 / R18194 / 383) TaxID=482957 RepID=UPI0013DE69B0|nr:hypothetical protein [Burkholderia lata]